MNKITLKSIVARNDYIHKQNTIIFYDSGELCIDQSSLYTYNNITSKWRNDVIIDSQDAFELYEFLKGIFEKDKEQ